MDGQGRAAAREGATAEAPAARRAAVEAWVARARTEREAARADWMPSGVSSTARKARRAGCRARSRRWASW